MTSTLHTHAGGIVVRFEGKQRKYLLVRSRTNMTHWVFPKGHIKPGESPKTAALREVREEAGVRAEVMSVLGESKFIRGEETIFVLYFTMRYQGSAPADEGRKVEWCSYEDAATILSSNDARQLLQKAEAMLTE